MKRSPAFTLKLLKNKRKMANSTIFNKWRFSAYKSVIVNQPEKAGDKKYLFNFLFRSKI